MRTSHETEHRAAFGASRTSQVRDRMGWLELCFARRSERRILKELSDGQLRDIGVSRSDAEREWRRWPWDGRPRGR